MKRILNLLLCLALLFSSVACLASCKKDTDQDDNGSSVVSDACNVDLTGYSVVLGVELTDLVIQQAYTFARNVSKLTTVDMSVVDDAIGDVVKTKNPEILIGVTTREESIKTYNEIKGNGWAVSVFEHKIAIVGTTPYLTAVALGWFERTYLNAEHVSGTALSVQEKNVVSNLPILSLTEKVEDADTTFRVVYETGKDANDAPHQVGSMVCDSLLQKTGLTAEFLTADAESTSREILVGNMSRSDVKEEMAKIEADEYAVTVKDNKIYLVAWSDVVLPSAYELFEEMMFASALLDENGNVVSYSIPSDCTLIKKYASDWITDFPKPVAEGLYPEAAVDANDGALQYIYCGTGATRETFVAYCETLKAAGYTPMGNEDVQWEGSSFRTFVNNEKGVSLHVSHMAFAHAAEQNNPDTWDMAVLPNSIRIVSASTEWGGKLVDAQYFRPQVAGTDYVDRAPSKITSNLLDNSDGNWGLGQVITLADGSFIIIDGGRNYGVDEVPNLWNLLKVMHTEAYGEPPTKENPIHIRAWIVTHEHGDHHNIIRSFCSLYGPKHELRFDYLLFNPGSENQLRIAGGNYNLRNQMKQLQETVKNGFEYIQVSTGQVFYFANCRLEILTTVDDAYPWRCNETNNANTVTRTALYYGADGADTSQTTTSLWLGDAEWQMSRVARAMYGSFLASDQVQVSHHGNWGGSEKQLYELVGNCSVIWYPGCVSQGALNNCMNDKWSYSAAFKNPECKLLIFNGAAHNSGYGMWNVTLKITKNGALFDELYDPDSGDDIEAKGILWNVVDVPAYRGW